MVVAQSFAKNFGLYSKFIALKSFYIKLHIQFLDERVGNLTFVVNESKLHPAIRSQISLVIRATWSNPPAYGARIVQMILTNPDLRQQWFDAIKVE